MTDTTPNPGNPGSHRSSKFYPLTPELAKELREIGLHASEWRLWSFLTTFEPFGNEYAELPDLVTILAECNLSKATFYRAISKFIEHELFDTQVSQIQVRNLRGSKVKSHPCKKSLTGESQSLMGESQSLMGETISFQNKTHNVTPDSDRGDSAKCTNNREQEFKENKQTVPPNPPCSKDVDSKGLGTGSIDPLTADVERFCRLLQEAGVRPNKTIQTTLSTLLLNESAAAVRRLVENSISALQEQEAKGTVRNPGGFINAALRCGFTANGAKVEARERRRQEPNPEESFGFPVEPPSLNQISQSVDMALIRGDRPFALGKLQQLWSEGHHDLVEEMLYLFKRDWGFSLTNEGIRDHQQIPIAKSQSDPSQEEKP